MPKVNIPIVKEDKIEEKILSPHKKSNHSTVARMNKVFNHIINYSNDHKYK